MATFPARSPGRPGRARRRRPRRETVSARVEAPPPAASVTTPDYNSRLRSRAAYGGPGGHGSRSHAVLGPRVAHLPRVAFTDVPAAAAAAHDPVPHVRLEPRPPARLATVGVPRSCRPVAPSVLRAGVGVGASTVDVSEVELLAGKDRLATADTRRPTGPYPRRDLCAQPPMRPAVFRVVTHPARLRPAMRRAELVARRLGAEYPAAARFRALSAVNHPDLTIRGERRQSVRGGAGVEIKNPAPVVGRSACEPRGNR
jgi:hypothetical protein